MAVSRLCGSCLACGYALMDRLDRFRAYEPPTGMKALPVNVTTAASEFEWNELAKRSGVELWCMRVPSNVR